MSSFTTPLRVTPVDGEDNLWELLETFEYELGAKGSGNRVVCPAGERTDFASIPRILWSILPPWGKYGKAAVIHDHLCVFKCYHDVNNFPVYVTRAQGDAIFLEAMEVLNVPPFVRNTMYKFVRAYAIIKGYK